MADSTPAPETTAAADPKPESVTQSVKPDPSSPAVPPFPNPNPSGTPPPSVLTPPPPQIQPSFRPAAPPVHLPPSAAAPPLTPVTYQTPGVPPPGVLMASAPAPGVGGAPPPQVPPGSMHPGMPQPYAMPGQPIRYAPPMPNGYAMPQPLPQGAMPPPGVPRYPFAPMVRPGFPPRPLIGVMPPLARPPIIGIRGPIIPPIVRPPIIPIVAPVEEPQTTVYIGKLSSTVENDFMLSLLQLCGPVKNWKRPQDPTGALKGFGICEFESAEGVLRAMRILNKLSLDGQELMLNVGQKARKYLERYVEKKLESLKNIKKSGTEGSEKEEESASGAVANETGKSSDESLKQSSDEQKKDDNESNKENPIPATFGLVTDEDREADREALEKFSSMIEERLKNKPLPPPPPPPQRPVDLPGHSNSEQPSGSRDRDSEEDVAKNDSEEKNEDEKTGDSKPSSEHDKTETGTPDRSRRHDRRDRDHRREKERELERYEREREQERAKREKEREYRSREDERRYKAREKEWETREREREHWRKREREREKERAQERKWEILDQERDDDSSYGKKRKYKTSDEERKRRQREKEEDIADRLREEEEIAEEAKLRAEEDQQKKQLEELKIVTSQPANGHEKAFSPNVTDFETQDRVDQISDEKPSHGTYKDGGVSQNGISEEFVIPSNTTSDARQNSNLPSKKLGFGLSGSGKRAAVPSVFNEDEDEEAHKDKKMRPLVPIDYSTEEQQAVQSSSSEGQSAANMVAAAEFVKRISDPREEKADVGKEKSRRSHERSSHRDRDRHEDETYRTRDENRKDSTDREKSNKTKTPENQKLFDAKQLIDTIPKTKDELFSYEINWVVYDQNSLHERMRPWISKKITDFLGEEEVTLVDYIVSSTQEHVDANEMLERLQTILDDEAEMFVLKMWRMLIFEIKRVETGIAPKQKA